MGLDKFLFFPYIRSKINISKAKTRKSTPCNEAQRVGVRWEPDANGMVEWTCELCAERASGSSSPHRRRPVIRARDIGLLSMALDRAPYPQREVGFALFTRLSTGFLIQQSP